MAVSGIGTTGYPAGYETRRTTIKTSKRGFASRIGNTYTTNEIYSSNGGGKKTISSNTAMEAYLASASYNVKERKTAFDTYESENYKLVPDNEAGCFDIYNKSGKRIGAFLYSDIKIRGIAYDTSIDNKTKDEMTMDEYKQWFRNEVSKMPVSAFVSSTFISDTLIITEEAFKRMKNDPEWEKRHEEFEKKIEEQIKEAQEKSKAQRELAQINYFNSQLASQQRLQRFFVEKI